MPTLDQLTPRQADDLALDFTDHATFCRESLSIENLGGSIVPLELMPGQIKLNEAIAAQRKRGKPVRIVVLKNPAVDVHRRRLRGDVSRRGLHARPERAAGRRSLQAARPGSLRLPAAVSPALPTVRSPRRACQAADADQRHAAGTSV